MTVRIDYSGPATAVRFLERPNRYLALVRRLSGGPEFEAHVPNPGRMEELLVPNESVGWVVEAYGPHRRTWFDLVSVRHGRTIVSIDARIGNRLVGRALAAGALGPWVPGGWRAEVGWGPHRFDFARLDPRTRRPISLLEVKSSNLRVGASAFFPDAPTERGRNQLRALARAQRQGISTLVVFIVQRADVTGLSLNHVLDPDFGRAANAAARAGVRFRAYTVKVQPTGIVLDREVPVTLSSRVRARGSKPLQSVGA